MVTAPCRLKTSVIVEKIASRMTISVPSPGVPVSPWFRNFEAPNTHSPWCPWASSARICSSEPCLTLPVLTRKTFDQSMGMLVG